jgi:hypothetical protein
VLRGCPPIRPETFRRRPATRALAIKCILSNIARSDGMTSTFAYCIVHFKVRGDVDPVKTFSI